MNRRDLLSVVLIAIIEGTFCIWLIAIVFAIILFGTAGLIETYNYLTK